MCPNYFLLTCKYHCSCVPYSFTDEAAISEEVRVSDGEGSFRQVWSGLLDDIQHLQASPVMDVFLGVVVQEQGGGIDGHAFVKSQSVFIQVKGLVLG